MAWILKLVKTAAEGEGQSKDVMEIIRPDDLGDIADLGLTLTEAKLLLADVQQEIVAASEGARGAPAELPVLWRRLLCEGLPGAWRSEAFRPSHGAASTISLRRVWRD